MTIPTAGALADLLRDDADSLDRDARRAGAVVPALAAAGLPGIGVPLQAGGAGGCLSDAVDAIARVAESSLAVAFVLWAQRASVEYLVAAEHEAPRERGLADLLSGRRAGATGLSNAMKFLSGIESLAIRRSDDDRLNGRVPWATNLRPADYLVTVAISDDPSPPFIAMLPHDRAGLVRSDDLDLIGLRGTHTASLDLHDLALEPADILTHDARRWLPRVRPAFLGLQCGLSIGLARAALAAARADGRSARAVLDSPIDETSGALEAATSTLLAGVDDDRFVADPVALFRLRIELAEHALAAVQIELEATGGRAYHRDGGTGFERRWREAAFLPIVTPSLTQLRGELAKYRQRTGAG